MDCARVVGILLAAGAGSRFGGNKLEAMFGDRMLGTYAAATMATLGLARSIAIHDPAHVALAHALAGLGFTLIANTDPTAGLSRSLRLATHAATATQADAMLVCLADMPFVTTDHMCTLIDTADANHVVATAAGDIRMPPAVFPRALWPALANMTGDSGARALLADAKAVSSPPEHCVDIDTMADLERMTRIGVSE